MRINIETYFFICSLIGFIWMKSLAPAFKSEQSIAYTAHISMTSLCSVQ